MVLEREYNFSLHLQEIRPLAVFGTRRETAPRREGFACVPDLGSFLKLREISYFCFREREYNFSLDLQEIQPSAVFGTRKKTAPCEEGFAWVPDLGSFLKLREVGVSPYLGLVFV